MPGILPTEDRIPQIAFFFFCSIFCGIFGVVLSSILLYYHARKHFKDISTLVYITLNANHLLLGIMLWFIVPSLWDVPRPMAFDVRPVCITWSWIWNIASKTPTYLVLGLALIRLRRLEYPLRADITQKWVVVGMVMAFSIMTLFLVILPEVVGPIRASHRTSYRSEYQRCDNNRRDLSRVSPALELINEIVFGMLGPYLVLAGTTIALVRSLRRLRQFAPDPSDTNDSDDHFNRGTFKRTINKTKTIIQIAALFVILHGAVALDNLNQILTIISFVRRKPCYIYNDLTLRLICPTWYMFLLNFYGTHIVFISATGISFIILYTSDAIRKYCKQQVTSFRRPPSSGSTNSHRMLTAVQQIGPPSHGHNL